jgi:hypothetical protein
MTDDLVQRLRRTYRKEYAPTRSMCGDNSNKPFPFPILATEVPVNPDGHEAADRIEALTAENERLKLELESAKDMFDRHVEWASEQNAVVVCPRAIPPLNYCTDCDGSFPCRLQALEKQP